MKVLQQGNALKTLMTAMATILGGVGVMQSAQAATWSDTSIGWRYGTQFAEPYKNDADGSRTDITKQIFNLTHASGDKYGSNFFNVDLLQSNDEPNSTQSNNKGTQEAYVVIRRYLDLGAITKTNLSVPGYIRGAGLTAGLDWNTKNDSYSSKKRMWVVGPTIQFDVPGFLDFSILALVESNDPSSDTPRFGYSSGRYTYDTHAAAQFTWGIPIAKTPLSFEGYALWIDSKGKNESGGDTKAETHIDARVMYDLSSVIGLKGSKLRAGAGYEYWKNKFGNDTDGFAGKGATASTPMVRVDYHF